MIINSFKEDNTIFAEDYEVIKKRSFDRAWARQNPVEFIEKYFNVKLWSKQKEIINSVRDNRITAVKSCNAIGKTFTAAITAMQFLLSYEDSIVIITAPTHRQVKNQIFSNINKIGHKVKQIEKVIINDTEVKISKNWFCLGLATNDEDRFQGWHSDHILIIADEGSGIDDKIFEAIDSVLVSGMTQRLLATGNPLRKSGRFYRMFDNEDIKQFSISSFDTPNFKTINSINQLLSLKTLPEITHTYLTTPEAVISQIKEHGKDSPFIQSRVLAEFPDQEINVLIPRDYVLKAVDRFKPDDKPPIFGCDVARFGDDSNILARRIGYCITDIFKLPSQIRTSILAKEIATIVSSEYGYTYIDSIGVGAGVVDSLYTNEKVVTAKGVNVAMKSTNKKFVNLRAELYWKLRGLFLEGKISIPDNSNLIDQLSDIYYSFDSSGRIIIEPKADIKKRTGTSPDEADAVMLSFSGKFEVVPGESEPRKIELKKGGMRIKINNDDDDYTPFDNVI